MFRPATPLSVVVGVAFILLLIPVLSAPILKGIKLATYQGVDFGVFGYCKGKRCSKFSVGYNADSELSSKNIDFSLPANARRSLSALLIVHPIAALFTLVLLILSLVAHFHSPARSPKYLLIILILMLPTFLLSLLAFLTDVLIFVPHLQWGTWLVLAATIVLAIGGIVICGMRRALLSRRAHHKRIADNAEMNGDSYRSNNPRNSLSSAPLTRQPTVPQVDPTGNPDKLPEFATYDPSMRHDDHPAQDGIPLNSRNPSVTTSNGTSVTQRDTLVGTGPDSTAFRAPKRSSAVGGGPYADSAAGSVAHITSPPPPFAAQDPHIPVLGDARLPDRYANTRSPPSYAASPPPGFLPSRSDAGGNPRNVPAGRAAGPNGPWSPSALSRPNHGMQGTSAVADTPFIPGPGGRGGQVGQGPELGRSYESLPHGATGPYSRGPMPRGFSETGSPSSPYASLPPGSRYLPGSRPGPWPSSGPGHSAGRVYTAYNPRSPSPGRNLPAAGPVRGRQSPPPVPPLPHHDGAVGQAVEMDATTGSPSPSRTPFAAAQSLDGGSHSNLSLTVPQRSQTAPMRESSDGYSPSSVYSPRGSYVPARAGWTNDSQHTASAVDLGQSRATIQHDASPVELPHTRSREAAQQSALEPLPTHSQSGGAYYEDVDPRFAVADPKPTAVELPGNHYQQGSNGRPPFDAGNSNMGLTAGGSHESNPGMARMSAFSETSHYSQGGAQPDWPPPAAPADAAADVGSFARNAGGAHMPGSSLPHATTSPGGPRNHDAYAGPYGHASAGGG